MVKQPRPKTLSGTVSKYNMSCGNAYITVNTLKDKPFEIFAEMGKAGGCTKCLLEAIARCVSLGIRCGISKNEFVEELQDIGCPGGMYQTDEPNELFIKSCPDAIAHMLKPYPDNEVPEIILSTQQVAEFVHDYIAHDEQVIDKYCENTQVKQEWHQILQALDLFAADNKYKTAWHKMIAKMDEQNKKSMLALMDSILKE